jgi:hypothetical protein
MEAGPLVVFGFLVLPALSALRVAPGLGAAFAISGAIGVLASVGGFQVAYRADLPTGPTSVALAAAGWLVAATIGRLAARRRSSARSAVASSLLLLLPLLAIGCAGGPAEPEAPLPRGTLPDLSGDAPILVVRFGNDTGSTLRIPGGNPIAETRRALADSGGWTVPDALQAQAILELSRRGFPVRGFEESRAALPDVASDPSAAAARAREAGLDGPLLFGRLRRFTPTGSGLLLVRLDLALVDASDGARLWSGSAKRPVPIGSALTMAEIVHDAAPVLFAEAFGHR